MRGSKHLFEIPKTGYWGSTDSGRNPNSVPTRRWRQGLFMRKGRRTITWIGLSIDANKLTLVLIQKNVFNFQSDSHNVSFFYKQLFGIQCCFRLNPKFILPSFDTCKVWGERHARQFLWGWQHRLYFKVDPLILFFTFFPFDWFFPWRNHWSVIGKQHWLIV